MKIWRDLAILILIAASVWALFTQWPEVENRKLNQFSLEQEDKLGKYVLESLSKDPDFQIYENKQADSVLHIIHQRLLDSMGLTVFDYHVYIFDNEMINAFALPGGHMMISTGLLEFAESAEEVAAVVAHEMGHIENRHVMKKLIKALGISILLSNDQIVLGEISQTVTSTSFDRKHEAEADRFSMELLEKCEISPRVIASFFRRVSSEVGTYDERLEIFMTHPHNNARIKSAIEYELPENFETIPYDIDWNTFKNEILYVKESTEN
jgi:predicted Zn-dependent protease